MVRTQLSAVYLAATRSEVTSRRTPLSAVAKVTYSFVSAIYFIGAAAVCILIAGARVLERFETIVSYNGGITYITIRFQRRV